jgi:prepilin-type N-terminal cleavage/methylation domain-containing protein
MYYLLQKIIHREIIMGVNEKKRMDEKGFTIIEMMVVIGIIAILAMAAIPAFSLWIPDHRLKMAVQDLYSNMQLAKMEAIRTKGNRSLVFNPGADTYTKADGTAVDLNSYGSGIEFGNGNATNTAPGDVASFGDFVTYATPENEASFNSRGMGNNSGFVYLTNSKNKAYAVGSLTSGVIVLRKWKNGWE